MTLEFLDCVSVHGEGKKHFPGFVKSRGFLILVCKCGIHVTLEFLIIISLNFKDKKNCHTENMTLLELYLKF